MATPAPPGVGLTTQSSRETKGLRRVLDEKRYQRKSLIRGTLEDEEYITEAKAGSKPPIAWKVFHKRHVDYMGDYWEECRALYAGGPKLLRDKELLTRIFPAHNAEDPAVYEERVKRAFYFAYAGTIIDNLVAGLNDDPISVSPEMSGDKDKDEVADLDGELKEFLEDVSPEGGQRQTMQRLLLEAIREALVTRVGWILVDLPQTPEEYVDPTTAPQSLLDQERAGLLSPYAIGIEAEYVINWQDDSNGELEWAMVCDSELRQDSFDGVTYHRKTFTIYDRAGWRRYRIDYLPNKPPTPDTLVRFLDEGQLPFGKVPLVRIQLPEGLWAMGKLESLAKEHFNKRAAVSWAEFKSLFAILYEFLAPEEAGTQPVSTAQMDPNRALNQTFGPGHSQLRGHQDSASYVGPDVAPFKEGRESCSDVMREMHRVFYSMALSANMDSAAIKRSGDSKQRDDAKIEVILKGLAHFLREAVKDILVLWQKAKREVDHRVGGGEEFQAADVMRAIEQAVELLNGVPMKSPTFKKAFLLKLYRVVMGEELTQDEWAEVRKELDEAINAETEMLEDPSMTAARLMAAGEPEDEDDDDDEAGEDDDNDDPDRPSAARPPSGRRTLIDTAARR